MKKLFISFICLTTILLSTGQMVTSFSTDPAQFIKDLEKYVTASKAANNIEAMNQFKEMASGGKISSSMLNQVITTSNAMLERRMQPAPYFVNYLNTVMNIAKGGSSDEQFAQWNKILDEVLKNQRKGDNNDFLKFIDFSNDFFQQNALSITAARSWRVDANSYKFVYDGNKPHVSFSCTNLYGCIKGDTISVLQTVGDYYPLETRWVGQSGKVTWQRAGLDPYKVYCTFNNYVINISNVSYTVDTVTFYHNEYFKQPLKGKLTDKLVAGADSTNMTYPRFESYDVGITVKDIAPNVSYTGGFSMNGNRVIGYGTADNKGQLTFYARDGKTKVVSARSQSILIRKGEELGASKAEVSIYFGTDSIYHPQLDLIYKIPKREMRLLRGETGIGKAKFTDSYHNEEFQTDAIFWNLDSSVLNLKILSGVGQKPGIYESVNYFNKDLIRQLQGYTSYEPLSILKKMTEKYGSRDLNVTDLARAINPNLKEGELKSLLYELVEGGFINYNEDQGIVTVRDKAINYVLANAKKIDYDIIHIRSAPQSGNDYIDLQNSNIDLKGVYNVPISDTSHVYFRPRDHSLSLEKDRDMEFDGTIVAGRTDLIGFRHKFQYAPFTVELTKVDTMRLNVPDSGKVDENGEPILKHLKSKIEGIVGLLEVDAPINKSGRTKLPQFPKLYSREKSYIYYDDSTVAGGAYNRKNFFFELQPFHLDSLDNFSPDIVNWQGRLVSGGIFPDIKDSIHIQSDESLGFKSETPPGGYDLYQGKGKYYGKYELNYNGLHGEGRITHSTADFKTKDVRLYPDSMLATTDTFAIAKTFEGVKTPAVFGESDAIFWRPKSDSMYITMMDKNHPFAMYDTGFTTFKGGLLLDSLSLRGNGTLDWNEATLSSKNFAFHTMDLAADTSSLEIKTTGDKVTFKSPDVSARVDFKTRVGDFVSNQKDVPTDFAYNQYNTGIAQFKWYMDNKILDFKVPDDSKGEYFTSTRPEMKGLRFIGRRATYNLVTSLLRVEQVPEIRVADASVIPDSGVVVIEEQAKMHQLRNAVIIADTINKSHRFENAVVDIFSKEELQATGDYNYTTRGIKQTINFGEISCKKETEGARKKDRHDEVHLTAKSNVDEKQNFVIYPNVGFNGEVSVVSVSPLINFKGFAKINFKQPKAASSDFFINQPVNRDTLGLYFSDSARSSTGNPLVAGIHWSSNPDAPNLYSTLLSPKQDNNDITIFKASGMVTQLPSGDYLFGDTGVINGSTRQGNTLRYDDERGFVKAEGKFNLGLNLGMINTVAAGKMEAKLDTGKYKFNFTAGIGLLLPDKIQERLEFYMVNDNANQPDITYDKEEQKKPIYQLSDAKDDGRMLDDLEKTSAFTKRPKNLDENLVFTDVGFVFDTTDVTLRSTSKLGVAMLGKKAVNKKIDGYIEFQYKLGGDAVTIYLQNATKDWFYFEYRPGVLSILSSYDDVNKLITSVAPEKRRVKGDKGQFYLYTQASSLNKDDFVAYMKDKASGIVRARPEPHMEVPLPAIDNVQDDTTAQPVKKGKKKNAAEQVTDSTGAAVIPPPDMPKSKRKKKQQQEESDDQTQQPDQQQQPNTNLLDQMKMNNQSILSGPPPDRQKPKTDTVQPPATIPAPIPVKTDPVPVKQNLPPPVPVQTDTVKQVVPTPQPLKTDSIPPRNSIQPAAPNAGLQAKTDSLPVKPNLPPPVPAQKDTTPVKQAIPPPQPIKTDSIPPQNSIQPVQPNATQPVKTDSIQINQKAPKTDSISIQPTVIPAVKDSVPH